MAWADPELAVGVGVAVALLEVDADFAVVPEPPDVAFADAGVLVPDVLADDVDAGPGRVKATTPAVPSPAAPTATVAARSRARPRRRAATAGRVSSLRLVIRPPLVMPGPVPDAISVAPGLVTGLGRTSGRPLSVMAGPAGWRAGRCGLTCCPGHSQRPAAPPRAGG